MVAAAGTAWLTNSGSVVQTGTQNFTAQAAALHGSRCRIGQGQAGGRRIAPLDDAKRVRIYHQPLCRGTGRSHHAAVGHAASREAAIHIKVEKRGRVQASGALREENDHQQIDPDK